MTRVGTARRARFQGVCVPGPSPQSGACSECAAKRDEAGAVVQPNAYLRDMNLGVPAADERRIEVLASGLPCYGGAQLAVDITVRHFLAATGEARAQSTDSGGQLLLAVRRDKERRYAELVRSRWCKLIVVAISTGGRWSSESLGFVHDMAFAKARQTPQYMRKSAAFAWQRRWTRMLSVASASAFAHSLTSSKNCAAAFDGPILELCDLFAGREAFSTGRM